MIPRTRNITITMTILTILISVIISNTVLASMLMINYPIKRPNDLSAEWFELKDANHNFIDDQIEALGDDTIVRAVIVLSCPVNHIHINLVRSLGGRIVSGPWDNLIYGFAVEMPKKKLLELGTRLLYSDANLDGLSDLKYIEKDVKFHIDMHYLARAMNFRPILWNMGLTGKYVTVAVIDTGVDIIAPGLYKAYEEGRIVGLTVTDEEWYYDMIDHGTHIVYMLLGSVNGTNGNLDLSSGFRIITTNPSDPTITVLLTPQFSVFSTGKLVVKIKVYPYSSTYKYHAYLLRLPPYANTKEALDRQNYTIVNDTSVVDDLGGYVGEITLSCFIDNDDLGNYVVGLWSDYPGDLYLWINASVPSFIENDHYDLSKGLLPDGRVFMFKVADSDGNIYLNYVIDALQCVNDYIDQFNISVVSMSISTSNYSELLREYTLDLVRKGIVIVSAAGNNGTANNNPASRNYPGAFPWVISVAATDGFNNITDYSSMGGPSTYDQKTIKPDVSAMGGRFAFGTYSADSNDEKDYLDYYGIYEPDKNDLEYFTGTSVSTVVVAAEAALIVEVFRETILASGISLWERMVSYNATWAALTVKSIIDASAFETYPLIREYNGTDNSLYSPTLDKGEKDPHEGYGVIDPLGAISIARSVAEYLKNVFDGNQYPYDYAENYGSTPYIVYNTGFRKGALYNPPSPPYLLNYPFGRSVDGICVHFIRYTWIVDQNAFSTKYGLRLISTSSDPAKTDFDIQVYMINDTSWDPELLTRTTSGLGATDEIAYFTPPVSGSNNPRIYLVTIKRAREDSAGGNATIIIGPHLEARFTHGRYIWVNATATSPIDTARYALIIVYYRNATGTFVYRQAIAETSDLNGFANVHGNINIMRGVEDYVLERLEDDYEWYVGVVFTSDKRGLNNLTTSSVVEGPIVVKIDIGEPTVLDISSPGVVLDHTRFAIIATLTLNDTGAPIEGKTIYFYRSTDLQYWSLIGSNTTNTTGKAVLYVEEPSNGSVYYLAVYHGDNETQYTWTGYAVRTDVFLVTKVVLEVSDTSPYTMEPVTITAKLLVDATDEPIEGEPVTIWLSHDDGSTWVEAYTGLTDENGSVTYTHIFLSSGSYLVKANFTGDPPHMILESGSQTTTITSKKTPTNMEISMNTTDLRVYDTIGFTVRLNYTYNTITKPIIGADVYLEQWDGTTWSIVDTDTTDTNGYALLTYTFLTNGTYTFRIHYPGNDTFTEYISDSIILGVKNLATSIELVSVPSSGAVEETLSATIRLLDERGRPIANEPVTLQKLVGGTWVDVDSETTNTTGEAMFSWSEPAAGDYTYRVVYSGKDYVYNGSLSNTFTVTITTLTTGLVLSANTSSTIINKTVKLVAQLYSDGSPVIGETVYLQVYTESGWTTINMNTTDSNGYTVFLVSEKYASNYTFRAYYPGSSQYSSSTSNELTIEFKPIPTTITLSLPATTYTVDQCIITATLTTIDGEPLSGYQIYFWISSDGTTWILLGSNTTDPSGKAIYKHVFWVSGTYYVKANFSDPGKDTGQWEYAESEATGQIIVEETTTVLVATYSATSAYINESITIEVSLRDIYGNPIPDADIQVLINGSLVQTLKTSSDGTGELVLSYPYYYIIEVGFAYAGNETYAGDATDPEILVWNPLPTTISISVSNITPVAGQTITITATIIDTLYGNPVKGYNVFFWVSPDRANWVLIGTSTTDSTGTAIISYTPSTSGTLFFRANFTDPAEGVMGSWVYSSSESTMVTVTVLKRPVTITIISISPSEPVINEAVNITVQVTSLGEPITGLQLYLYNGSILLGTADIVDGTAVIEHVFTEAGLYELSIVFPGNDVYESSTKEFNITVKHMTTINLTVDYETLPNGSIKFVLKARLLIDGSPYPNKTIYFYKKGSWILIGTNTTDSTGTAILTYIDNSPSRTYVFSANYTSTEPIVAPVSGAVTLSLPAEALMAPMPELWVTPLILLGALVFILLVRRRR